MDFSSRLNRPAQANVPSEQPNNNPMPMHTPKPDGSGNKPKGKFLDFSRISAIVMLFCGALIAIALVLVLVFGGGGGVNKNREKDLINGDKYQAVFLDSQDGQVYFGKLAIYNEELYVLQDIYYVRVETPIQPASNNQNSQSKISLAKLGSELHGPEDFMFIARDKVLYWENLKDDGQVVKAITDYKKNGSSDDNNNSTQTQTPTNEDENNEQNP